MPDALLEVPIAATPAQVYEPITALDPNRKVPWAVKHGAPGWAATSVTWDLMPLDSGTKVRFAHQNYPSAESAFAQVAFNWAWYLMSLKEFLETGKGRPGDPPR